MNQIYGIIKSIIKASIIGFVSKREPRFVPQQSLLKNDCYEDESVIYSARPLGHKL